MKTIKILVLLLGLGAVCFGQKNPRKAELEPVKSVRQIDFKTLIYGKKKHFALMRTAFGDLTGDEIEEAAVLWRNQNLQTSGSLDEISVYSIKDGKIVELANFPAGVRGEYVLSIGSLDSNFKIEEKIFTLDLAVLRKGEGSPTKYYTVEYRWKDFQMEETNRSCLKFLPENMREVG